MPPPPLDVHRLPRSRARWARGCAYALASLGGLWASGAEAAAPAAAPFGFRYTAPPACIDAATFRQRLAAIPVAPNTAPAQGTTIAITISERGGVFTGDVAVDHADGTTIQREVSSARCDEVVDALELVAALGLGLERPPAAPPPPPPPPPVPVPSPAPSPPLAEAPAEAHWQFRGALRLALLSGAGPNFEPGPDVALGIVRDAPGILAPSFEISGTWATSGNIQKEAGNAVLTLWGGALAACPLRFALSAGFGVRPCAQLAVGALSGSGSGTNVAQSAASVEPRVTVAVLVRLEWQLSGWFSLEAEAGPNFEISRDRFYFEPSGAEVYTAPVLGSLIRFGGAIRWP
jgi:hypothetical protein